MKTWIVFLICLAAGLSFSGSAFSQTSETGQEGRFTTRGVITKIDGPAKTIFVRNDGGLELTFHLDEGTQIRLGKTGASLADLKDEDEVEMDYEYNNDYEKIVRTLTKSASPASAQKT